MADVKAAVDFVLRQEDSTLSGVVTNAPADRGGLTRFGLTAKWHPELVRRGFFQMTRDEALAIAEEVYSNEYIPHLNLATLNRTAVAVAMLSFAVVEGAARAVQIAQATASALGFALTQDGSAGPATLAALNALDSLRFVTELINRQRDYFQALVNRDSTQQKWLNGWDNRATAVLQYAQRTLIQ